jgi:metal-sulfur cluster biosynthetic enzyme
MPDLQSIHAALGGIVDPCSIATGVPISLVDMGMVKEVVDDRGAVCVTLRLTSPICWQAANIVAMVEEKVGAIPDVASVQCRFDAASEWMPDMMSRDAQARLRRLRPLPVRA